MAYSTDWVDSTPIDHTKFNATPGAIRALRVDIEQRLSNLFYGWISGETQDTEGVKALPYVAQAADPGAVNQKIMLYSKEVNRIAELFSQDEAANVCQITKGGKLNTSALDVSLAGLHAILNIIFYVGFTLMETTGVNPSVTYGFGTWVAWGTGQVPVGVDTGQAEFNTVEKTGGEKTHLLTIAEMPAHTHNTQSPAENCAGGGAESGAGFALPSGSTGGGGTHNNLQPYITCYFWKRTA